MNLGRNYSRTSGSHNLVYKRAGSLVGEAVPDGDETQVCPSVMASQTLLEGPPDHLLVRQLGPLPHREYR